MSTSTNMSQVEILIGNVFAAWQLQNKRVNDIVGRLSEEELYKETAPGRNRGMYLFGHLAAVSDGMLPLLGFGERLYPELDKLFLTSPDKAAGSFPSLETIKGMWEAINSRLTEHFNNLTPADWLSKHTAVNDADFAINPQRNKLGVLINRTNHQAYHAGQMTYLLKVG